MKKVINRRPKEYLKQGLSHCGCYSVKAILQAYGKDNSNKPEELHTNPIGRVTGSTIGKDYYTDMLKRFDIKAQTKYVGNLLDEEKIEKLKQLLCTDKPVMLRIGNGYGFSKKYKPLLAKFQMHWITLWGYDGKKKLFYVYDSALSKKYWDKNLPIGNTTRTYEEILRDWKIKTLNPLYLLFTGRGNYLYIELN